MAACCTRADRRGPGCCRAKLGWLETGGLQPTGSAAGASRAAAFAACRHQQLCIHRRSERDQRRLRGIRVSSKVELGCRLGGEMTLKDVGRAKT